MQKQRDQLAVLTFLESLPSEHTPVCPLVIGNSAVDSLLDISISLKCLPGKIT